MGQRLRKEIIDASGERGSELDRWRPLAINLWIASVISLFFVLRVFDSSTAHRLFRFLAAH